MKKASSDKHTLLIVFLTVFMDLVGFGIIIPIQPFFAESLGATPSVVTLLGASFSLMQFLFAPFWGRLSDRIGRRPIMLASIFASCVGYLLFAESTTLVMLFAARMLAGFGSANIGTAQAIIADSTSADKRAKGMGLIGAAFGLGFIFGPAIGGFFSQLGPSAPAFAAAFLCGLNFVIAFSKLPETLKSKTLGEKAAEVPKHRAFSIKALAHAARHSNVRELFIVYLLWGTSFSLMEQAIGLFIEAIWLPDTSTVGHAKRAAMMTATVLIVVGITATIVQGTLIGKLAKRFGEKNLMVMGMFMVALCYLCIPAVGATHLFWLFLVLFIFHATGAGVTNPSLSSLLSRSVDPNEQGGTLGLGQGLSALGRIFGPAMSGILFERYIGMPFLVGGALTGLAWLVGLKVTQPHGKPAA